MAITFWGISFVATKIALDELRPVTLIFCRFAIGSLLLLALSRSRPAAPPFAPHWRNLATMGFIGVFIHQSLQAHALTMTSAVSTGWLVGVTPVWSVILAALIHRVLPGRLQLAGIVIGFVGALVITTRGEVVQLVDAAFNRGDLLILISTVNWAVYTVVGSATLRALGALHATAGSMTAGTLMLLPLFCFTGSWGELGALSPEGWLALAFLAIACSALGYLLWYYALERLEASQVAAFLYFEPLVTLVAAIALLREPISPAVVAGGLIVLAGVALVQRQPRPA